MSTRVVRSVLTAGACAAASLLLGVADAAAQPTYGLAQPQSHLLYEQVSGHAKLTASPGGPVIINPLTKLPNSQNMPGALGFYWEPYANHSGGVPAGMFVTAALRPHHAYAPDNDYATNTFHDADGFDVVIRMSNTGSTPQDLGRIVLSGIRFGMDKPGATGVLVRRFQNNTTGGSLDYGSTASDQQTPNDPDDDSDDYEYLARMGPWPQGMGSYAPVAVLHSAQGDTHTIDPDGYTVGVALLYDPRQYRHIVDMSLEWRAAEGGYRCIFNLNPDYCDTPNYQDGKIQPGETRLYTMTVRVLQGEPSADAQDPISSQRWLHLLVPYRNYFVPALAPNSGPEPDRRPIYGLELACSCQPGFSNGANPYGWGTFPTTPPAGVPAGTYPWNGARVDALGLPATPGGWKQLKAMFEFLRADRGWKRFMVWTPSGMRPLDRIGTQLGCALDDCGAPYLGGGYNYPSDVTVAWDASTAFLSTDTALTGSGMSASYLADLYAWATSTTNPVDLGMWWGYSGRVFTNSDNLLSSQYKWYGPSSTAVLAGYSRYNHANTSHKNWSEHTVTALRDQAGAATVALDSFTDTQKDPTSVCGTGSSPAWEAWWRLHDLHAAFPTTKFIIEPTQCDMLHGGGSMFLVHSFIADVTPHYLSDLLRGDAEVVVQIKQSSTLSGNAVRDKAIEAAGYGLTPLVEFWDSHAVAVSTTDVPSFNPRIPQAIVSSTQTVPSSIPPSPPALEIWPQPAPNVEVAWGGTTTLHIRAFGLSYGPPVFRQPAVSGLCLVSDDNLNYHWSYSPDNVNWTTLTDGTHFSGSQTPTLTINNADFGQTGYYRAEVGGPAGLKYSLNSYVLVIPD